MGALHEERLTVEHRVDLRRRRRRRRRRAARHARATTNRPTVSEAEDTTRSSDSAAECAEIYRRTKQAVGRIPYLGKKVRMHAYAPIESKPREKARIQNPKACRGSHPLQGNQRLVDATAVKPLGSHGHHRRHHHHRCSGALQHPRLNDLRTARTTSFVRRSHVIQL